MAKYFHFGTKTPERVILEGREQQERWMHTMLALISSHKTTGKRFNSLQGVAKPSAINPRVCDAYLKLYEFVSWCPATVELSKKQR